MTTWFSRWSLGTICYLIQQECVLCDLDLAGIHSVLGISWNSCWPNPGCRAMKSAACCKTCSTCFFVSQNRSVLDRDGSSPLQTLHPNKTDSGCKTTQTKSNYYTEIYSDTLRPLKRSVTDRGMLFSRVSDAGGGPQAWTVAWRQVLRKLMRTNRGKWCSKPWLMEWVTHDDPMFGSNPFRVIRVAWLWWWLKMCDGVLRQQNSWIFWEIIQRCPYLDIFSWQYVNPPKLLDIFHQLVLSGEITNVLTCRDIDIEWYR